MAQEQKPSPEDGEERREALRSWGPLGAIALLVALLAGGYFFGFVGDRTIAIVAAAAFTLALAAMALHAGFERGDGRLRAASVVVGLACLVVAVLPASSVLLPGRPDATAVLAAKGEGFELPAPGSYRVVVGARLKPLGEPRIRYRLEAGPERLEGVLERVQSMRRARRGPAMRVEEDHDVRTHELRVAEGGTRVRLESLDGETSGEGVTVRAYHLASPALLWALVAGLLAAATFLEGRFSGGGSFAAPAVGAVVFGFVLTTAPRAALGPVIGAAMLGAGGGVVGGTILRMMGTRIFGPRESLEAGEEAAEAAEADAAGAPPKKKRKKRVAA